jgi:hypothetical protein
MKQKKNYIKEIVVSLKVKGKWNDDLMKQIMEPTTIID